jgi:hypothetical protein
LRTTGFEVTRKDAKSATSAVAVSAPGVRIDRGEGQGIREFLIVGCQLPTMNEPSKAKQSPLASNLIEVRRDLAPIDIVIVAMNFDDPAIRLAFVSGAREAVESAVINLNPSHARELGYWLGELADWTGGEPPPSPYRQPRES